ncbi:protein kinase atn1 [Tritrichomonas foetus]|uniref:Protein kinase atn1 n=1 Tax=Tritrichomonas foetus TaxID=1144522 RepID=A0A1J4JB30_9EUKA|nr:protein kinase atn1 [Tritrichomonas foetus]|eukprot:OHS96382.1 protein kinase atn1 [Tritrichomonas foetus]
MLRKKQNRLNSISDFLKQKKKEGASQRNREVSPKKNHYQSWRINFSDLTKKKEVGSGVSAIVYFKKNTRTQNEVAIKKLKFKKLSGSKLQSFQREKKILAQAEHPTILHFKKTTDTPPFCIVTEWKKNGSLYHDLHKHHRLKKTMRTIAMFDIARGKKILHSRQIIHRDLK